jgi:hypothetical protein
MTQGVIAEWTKKEGETIKAGDCMAKVETDSACAAQGERAGRVARQARRR